MLARRSSFLALFLLFALALAAPVRHPSAAPIDCIAHARSLRLWSAPPRSMPARVQAAQVGSATPRLMPARVHVLEAGCTPIFRLFPTTGTCSSHAFWTYVCSRTSRTSRTCFGLLRSRPRCCRTGSARSGSRSHGYPIIARTRSTELRRSSAASPYVLTIVSSCSADSGLTQPPAAAYASCMTHAVSSSMYLNAPGLASCSSVRPLGHWDR
jgi:hypothetical protein